MISRIVCRAGDLPTRSPASGTIVFCVRCSHMSFNRPITSHQREELRGKIYFRGTTCVTPRFRIGELVGSPAIGPALERGSDTLPAVALRAVERVLCGGSLDQNYGCRRTRKHGTTWTDGDVYSPVTLCQRAWVASGDNASMGLFCRLISRLR
jgi:hypothetical protein